MRILIITIIIHLSQQILFSQELQNDSTETIKVRKPIADSVSSTYTEVFSIVEQMPVFPGGEKALAQYLKNISYPDSARANGIEGTVYVRFVINEVGEVTNITIPKGTHPLLNEAALALFKKMPLWRAGRQNGVPVKVVYVLPVKFSLN